VVGVAELKDDESATKMKKMMMMKICSAATNAIVER
jgi:hypothetical protein